MESSENHVTVKPVPKAAINSVHPGRETEAGRLTQASGRGSCMSWP